MLCQCEHAKTKNLPLPTPKELRMMTKRYARFQSVCRPTCLGLIALMLILAPASLWAQVDKATINGSVTDPSGAFIVGASVIVTNVETGVTYTGASNDAGIYRVSALPVGTYSVEYQKNGFKKV